MKRLMVLVLAGTVLLTACRTSSSSLGSDPNPSVATVPAPYVGQTNPYDTDMASGGAKIFQTNCEPCHGPQGHGDGPAGQSLEPKPRNLAVLQKSVGDDYLFWRISEGKPGTAMVAWNGILDENQIWQVVSFLRSLPE